MADNVKCHLIVNIHEAPKTLEAHFLPGLLDVNLCMNKQTNKKQQIYGTEINTPRDILSYLFDFVYVCINWHLINQARTEQ